MKFTLYKSSHFTLFPLLYFTFVMQHIKRGDFAVESSLSFVFDVLQLFVSSEWYYIYQNLTRHSNVTIGKVSKILTVFLISFLNFFHQYLRKPTAAKSLISMCCITFVQFWFCHIYIHGSLFPLQKYETMKIRFHINCI